MPDHRMTSASSSYRSMSGFEYDQTTSWSAAEIGRPAKKTQARSTHHTKDTMGFGEGFLYDKSRHQALNPRIEFNVSCDIFKWSLFYPPN